MITTQAVYKAMQLVRYMLKEGEGAASFPDVSLAAKGVGVQGSKGRGKDFASLLSPSRDPSRARTQFLVLLARPLHLLLNRGA